MKTEKRKAHLQRVEKLLARARLGFKCRLKWCRRHRGLLNTYAAVNEDNISHLLLNQCDRYWRLYTYLGGD